MASHSPFGTNFAGGVPGVEGVAGVAGVGGILRSSIAFFSEPIHKSPMILSPCILPVRVCTKAAVAAASRNVSTRVMYFTALVLSKNLSRFVALLVLECAFRLRHHFGKRFRLVHRQVREDFPIELDARQFQTMHQLRIVQAVQTRRRADAYDPQAAEISLLQLPSGVSKVQPALD